jgi:uncharacterized protein HemX
MAAAAAAVATVLVLGTAISTWLAIRATHAQRQTLDAQQKEAKQHRLTDEALARVQAQERLPANAFTRRDDAGVRSREG